MAIQSAEDYVAYFCRAFGVSLSDHDKGIFAAHLTARDDAIRAEERIALVVDVPRHNKMLSRVMPPACVRSQSC